MHPWRLQLAVVILFLTTALSAQQGTAKTPQATGSLKPIVLSVDPPDWFVQLPDPMLLVHGSGLRGADFSVEGSGVSLTRTQSSANGHWAFLWLQSHSAAPQTVKVVARNAAGAASYNFALKARGASAASHRGVTPADTIYLIMTDRFARGRDEAPGSRLDPEAPRGWHGGDLAGIREHLNYLQSLGITALWTTPVYDNGTMPDSYHGYAAVNYYGVDAHFGTLADYRALADELHERGMKLVFDAVPNHIGARHIWVSDPPAPEWLHGTLQAHQHALGGSFYALIDPHATAASRSDLLNGWFVDAMPDMNQENPLVSAYLIQNALWWVESVGVDAIRIDTFPYVDRPFWHDFHAALHAAYPNLTTFGEISNGDPAVTSFFAGGRAQGGIDTGLDTPLDFPLCFALRDAVAHDKPMTRLTEVLRLDSLYPHPGHLVQFFGNHDESRFLTEAGGATWRLKVAIGLMATLRGTPQLYSGDEIGMAGGDDPENRHDFPGSAFLAATRTASQSELFDWTSKLLTLRKSHAALARGVEQDLLADDTAFAFIRTTQPAGCAAGGDADAVLAVANKSDAARKIELATAGTALSGCAHLDSLGQTPPVSVKSDGKTFEVEVPAHSFVLLSVR